MASVRFIDVQARPTEFLDFTSLTLEEFRVCPTFHTRGSSGICGPCSINAAMSRDKYFIA